MPTLPTFNHPREERTQRMHNPPKVDVKHPPPVLLAGLKKTPSNTNPSIGHDKVGHPMLSEDVISNPPNSPSVSDVHLKSSPTNLSRGTQGSLKVNVNTQHTTPLPRKCDGGSTPNPTTGPGNKSKLPTQTRRPIPHPGPRKLPRSNTPAYMINKFGNKPSHHIGPLPNSPVPRDEVPPPKAIAPGISGVKEGRRNKGIPPKRDLLNRHSDPLRTRPSKPPNHVGPVKLNPVTSVPVLSMKLPPQPRHPPDQFRQNRHLKRPDIPGVKELPSNIPPPSRPHPPPHLIKIRPGDRRVGGKERRQSSHSSPGLDRPPVMSHKMNRPTPNSRNNSPKIPN